jgi:hypothetical protein
LPAFFSSRRRAENRRQDAGATIAWLPFVRPLMVLLGSPKIIHKNKLMRRVAQNRRQDAGATRSLSLLDDQ